MLNPTSSCERDVSGYGEISGVHGGMIYVIVDDRVAYAAPSKGILASIRSRRAYLCEKGAGAKDEPFVSPGIIRRYYYELFEREKNR